MTKVFNKTSEKNKRKLLRNNMPEAERIMWFRLKSKQLDGYKFRRQYSIGPFVVDFYCPQLKIAIEIDGNSHFQEGQLEYDQERENYIKAKGINILRFTNNEIYKNLEQVLDCITNYTEVKEG